MYLAEKIKLLQFKIDQIEYNWKYCECSGKDCPCDLKMEIDDLPDDDIPDLDKLLDDFLKDLLDKLGNRECNVNATLSQVVGRGGMVDNDM